MLTLIQIKNKVSEKSFNYIFKEMESCLCPKGSKQTSTCWDPLFVVKAKDQATYKNLVDVLDEFAICGARKYAIDRYTVQDSLLLIGQR